MNALKQLMYRSHAIVSAEAGVYTSRRTARGAGAVHSPPQRCLMSQLSIDRALDASPVPAARRAVECGRSSLRGARHARSRVPAIAALDTDSFALEWRCKTTLANSTLT